MRFIDTNIFIYSITNHPRFGDVARSILRRIDAGEDTLTSTLVLCEVSWVLEAMGRQSSIKPTLEKILSYESLQVVSFDQEDLISGASNMTAYQIDFNDGVNLSLMTRLGIREVYSNDTRHLGRVDFLNLLFG
ncbi:MAG: type II toxin-antitoxin system VapC family toxin [Thaumarchaeota archaeon]|nr:type II toxin-antitoxin system VapC family toxin [Nitrososphaerota archaeon]